MLNSPYTRGQDAAKAPDRRAEAQSATQAPRTITGVPTPISAHQENPQPRLFDARGTGTNGPAPRPVFGQPAPGRGERPEQIPANVAVREILQFIAADPNTANWGSEARQDLASTVIIAAYKAGHIGLWERNK